MSSFVTKRWIEVNDLTGGQYSVDKNIRFKTPMLRSDLCDYSDAYIVVKGTINLGATGNNDMTEKVLHLKIMIHLGHAYQKSITHLKTMLKILILLCPCIIC